MADTPMDISIPNCVITHTYHSATGRFLAYNITPKPGYCVHNSGLDFYEQKFVNGELVQVGEKKPGYRTAVTSVPATQDFSELAIMDGYVAYGENMIFARPVSEVPEGQCFGD